MADYVPKLPSQDLQVTRMHFDGYQHHHPYNIAEGDPLNYFVQPAKKKDNTYEVKNYFLHITFQNLVDVFEKIWKRDVNTRLSIPLPRPSVSPERRSNEQTTNSLSN